MIKKNMFDIFLKLGSKQALRIAIIGPKEWELIGGDFFLLDGIVITMISYLLKQ